MARIDINDLCGQGIKWGVGIATVPFVITTIITYIKPIFTFIGIQFLPSGTYQVPAFNRVQVPLLWQISRLSFKVGGTLIALSLITSVAYNSYINNSCRK